MKKEYIAVIQAGGKGTRMAELTKNEIPKPMLMINGKPMILWQIENLLKYGIKDICIITGFLGDKIKDRFSDGNDIGANISYIEETEPLGSAGSLFFVKKYAKKKDVILIFGDVMINIDFDRFTSFHETNDALATLLVHPNSHPFDSDLIILNEKGQAVAMDSKHNKRDYYYENVVNSGISILSNELLGTFMGPEKSDYEKDVIMPLMKIGRIYGYMTPEYVKDAGTPMRFEICTKEQKEGIWEKRCLSNRQKAVFLDRDGTINISNGFIYRAEDLELEDKAADAIKLLNESGYLAICVTNQPVIARGDCTLDELNYIHKKMQTLLGKQGAYLDDIIYCPHHPDKGHEGERPEYKIVCNCRKPKTGMIDVMAEKYNIDLENSWVIGDMTSDVMLGKNAGLNTILLKTGMGGNDGKFEVTPDYICDTLFDAVRTIIGKET